VVNKPCVNTRSRVRPTATVNKRLKTGKLVFAHGPYWYLSQSRSRWRSVTSDVGYAALRPAVHLPKLVLRALEHLPLRRPGRPSSAVHVKREHAHRRAEGTALPSVAPVGRAFQGERDAARALPGEDA